MKHIQTFESFLNESAAGKLGPKTTAWLAKAERLVSTKLESYVDRSAGELPFAPGAKLIFDFANKERDSYLRNDLKDVAKTYGFKFSNMGVLDSMLSGKVLFADGPNKGEPFPGDPLMPEKLWEEIKDLARTSGLEGKEVVLENPSGDEQSYFLIDATM